LILDADVEAQAGLLLASSIDHFGKGYSHDDVEHLATLERFENRVVSIMSEVSDYVRFGKSKEIQFAKERYFSHIISDIRNELAMIQHFLGQQEEILNDLLSDRSEGEASLLTLEQQKDDILVSAEKDRKQSSEMNWARARKAGVTLKKYQQRVRKIDGDAERIEKSIQDLLNLKRTHASIQEPHDSLFSARQSSE
jgi:signal transduction histidine kinase